MDLIISKVLVIPSKEIKWRFSRSSGPGGQKVNKNESRVEIIFNINQSKALNDYQKILIKENLKAKLKNNCICISVQDHRNQLLNRHLALFRIRSIIRNALYNSSKLRKYTKPSKASKNLRLELKKKRGELKKIRKKENPNRIF